MAVIKEVKSIHLSTLKAVLAEVIKDSRSDDPTVIANFLVDNFLSVIGREGKIARGFGQLEYYSKFSFLDIPYEYGRQLFILEG